MQRAAAKSFCPITKMKNDKISPLSNMAIFPRGPKRIVPRCRVAFLAPTRGTANTPKSNYTCTWGGASGVSHILAASVHHCELNSCSHTRQEIGLMRHRAEFLLQPQQVTRSSLGPGVISSGCTTSAATCARQGTLTCTCNIMLRGSAKGASVTIDSGVRIGSSSTGNLYIAHGLVRRHAHIERPLPRPLWGLSEVCFHNSAQRSWGQPGPASFTDAQNAYLKG